MNQSRLLLNRGVVACAGAVLLLAGLLLLGTDAGVTPHLPSWWPEAGTAAEAADRARTAAARTPWTGAALGAAAVICLLLALWTADVSLRPSGRRLPLPVPGAVLDTSALETSLSRRAVAIDGVARCRARVRRRARRRLDVRLRIALEPGTPPGEVVAPLAALLTETDASVDPYTLRTRVRLGARASGATRVGRTGVARPRTAGTADVR
ncbi:hypothetical protein [Streptomyces sp. NPDC005805]|uniref:hypothetical protein n=1 Tax=Streptomyces sp. NPDC005805 TaxID=3157068 RepID=UPI0033E284E6